MTIRFTLFGVRIASIEIDGGPQRWDAGGGCGIHVGEPAEDRADRPKIGQTGVAPGPDSRAGTKSLRRQQ